MDDKHKTCYPITRVDGFTLIELIAVMVIIATLGAVALPRFAHNDATVPAQADQLGRVIRHAQAMAMSQGQAFTVARPLPSISSQPPPMPLPMAPQPRLCVTLPAKYKPIH